jgi:hypothetical protein
MASPCTSSSRLRRDSPSTHTARAAAHRDCCRYQGCWMKMCQIFSDDSPAASAARYRSRKSAALASTRICSGEERENPPYDLAACQQTICRRNDAAADGCRKRGSDKKTCRRRAIDGNEQSAKPRRSLQGCSVRPLVGRLRRWRCGRFAPSLCKKTVSSTRHVRARVLRRSMHFRWRIYFRTSGTDCV